MKRGNNVVTFHQINGMSNAHGYGVLFMPLGLFFFAMGIWVLCIGEIKGLIPMLAGAISVCYSFSILKSHYCRVKFTEKEILLTMGPRVLQRMAKTDVQTLCLIIEELIVRDHGRVIEDLKEETRTYLLVMSPHPPSYFRYMAKRWINPEVEQREYPTEEAREYAIMDSAIDAYFRANMSNFKMSPSDGIWLEYTPERYEELKRQVPQAVDYVSDYEEKV